MFIKVTALDVGQANLNFSEVFLFGKGPNDRGTMIQFKDGTFLTIEESVEEIQAILLSMNPKQLND